MRKVNFILLVLGLIISATVSYAEDFKADYELTFRKQNKWIDQREIYPVRKLINDLKFKPLTNIKSICSSEDKFCKERVDILNLILRTQGLKQQIKLIEKSDSLGKNTMLLKTIAVDSDKLSTVYINYSDETTVNPLEESNKRLKQLAEKSNLKYLSQFIIYCDNVDETCKKRAKILEKSFTPGLSFLFNLKYLQNANLTPKQIMLVAHRHDYNFHSTPESIEKKADMEKPSDELPNYTSNQKTIVFKYNSAELVDSEKAKIEKLVQDNTNTRFYFSCYTKNPDLCKERIREIKIYALEKTKNIIELYQLDKTAPKNHIIITKE